MILGIPMILGSLGNPILVVEQMSVANVRFSV
jgi:hypothetical protein